MINFVDDIKSIKIKTKKALLIIDLQNDYFEGGLNPLIGSLEAVLKAQNLYSILG